MRALFWRGSWWVGRVLSIVALAIVTGPVFAEVVETTTIHVAGPVEVGNEKHLAILEKQFVGGDLTAARKTAGTMLEKARDSTAERPNPYDIRTSIVVVVWDARDIEGAPVLRRLTLPEPTSYPHSLDLPGLADDAAPPYLHEVLLATDRRARLVSQYTFTREENPVIAQIPGVVEKLTGPLFGLVSSVGGGLTTKAVRAHDPNKATSPLPLFATASHVGVPFERASVKVKSIARIPAALEDWDEGVTKLAIALRFETVPRSLWGREYANRLKTAAITAARESACTDDPPLPEKGTDPTEKEKADKKRADLANECLRAFDAAFNAAYTKCLTDCAEGVRAKEDVEAIGAVDNKFRAFVTAGGAAFVERSLDIKNRPLTHTSFGLGTAVIARGSLSRDRAKVDDAGNLAPDPMGRQLSMVILNWSPQGYDDDAPSPQRWERFRLFAGGTITPDPGIAIGGSMLIVRGVALNVGIGRLFTRGLGDGDEFGKPPSEKLAPLSLATADVLFFGVNLAYK